MNANYAWHQGADANSLAEYLSGKIALQIGESIVERGLAILALSGGSTPKPLFKALARHKIEWSKVLITLVDERWVDESHELSNAAFMQRYLLSDLPSDIRFVPLYQAAASAEESMPIVLKEYCQATNSSITEPRAFDVVVLGLGGDGHTASFFPDADNIAELVNFNSPHALLSCDSPSTRVARITWSLPMLLNTHFLALHFTGKSKQAVFEKAAAGGEVAELPIRAAIFQQHTQLNVYYAD